MQEIIRQLDLITHYQDLQSYFVREKDITINGDINLHKQYIDELINLDPITLPPVINLHHSLAMLNKQGAIKLREIYAFIQMARFFEGLKGRFKEGKLANWTSEIVVPKELLDLMKLFDYDGNLLDEASLELSKTIAQIATQKKEIKTAIAKIVSQNKLTSYLVDRQIHYINGYETLLLRGGFNSVLAGKVIDRTPAGFFYVAPRVLNEIAQKIEDLEALRENIVLKLEREFSAKLYPISKFLGYLDRSFDRLDHLVARVAFAKARDFEFIVPSNKEKIILKNFSHPALANPVPIDLDFSKDILLITGVNAGGKTMLLKGIVSACIMAKNLVPFKIDSEHSTIGKFKHIELLIEDPQSAKNDISTFAGRMKQFSTLFVKENALIGVDEIELGTDSDEAASLFKVILLKLKEKRQKIVITTHHKRLASLMAKYDFVELLAALYDEDLEKPTYKFLSGTIGRSYAFETALRYGVPKGVVNEAIEVHGEDKDRLNDLIERSSKLELELKKEIELAKIEREDLGKKLLDLEDKKFSLEEQYRSLNAKLEKEYKEAIDLAKNAAKKLSQSDIHKELNIAQNKKEKITISTPQKDEKSPLKVGDFVKYMGVDGVIKSIKKDNAQIECEGRIVYAPIFLLKRSNVQQKILQKPKITINRKSQASVKLDLHGLRVDEALEKLDLFISDALIAGFDEVLVYHGIGAGILARAVKEALREHPSVVSFGDAPINMGGYGATVIRL